MRSRSNSSICVIILFFLLISFNWIPAIASTKSLRINDKELFQYATFLYRSGEYYRAITEYKRIIFYFPNSILLPDAIMQIGRSYMAGGELDMAIDHWKTTSKEITSKDSVNIMLGLSYLDKDQHKVFSLRKTYVHKSIDQFSKIKTIESDFPEVNDFLNDWRIKPEPDYKSPWLAGSLSAIIPGTGSMYTGRYREGLYAFFITALFYIATIEAYHQDEKALSLVLGSFTFAFYGGNIYTAVNSAYKVNDKMDTDNLYDLRQKHGIWFIPDTMRHRGTY